MPDAFDGAGKPYKGASYRALLTILVGVIVAVIVIWYSFSWALGELDRRGENITLPPGDGFEDTISK